MNRIIQNHCFLHPSSVYVSEEPIWVTTVLGSCVAICFIDRKQNIGGINHYMMPYWNGIGLESPKYGNIAINQLFQKMLEIGAKKEDMVCKIFGGAEVLNEKTSVFQIGQRNIELAYKMISELGITIVSSSTGGKLGRKIHFNTRTGEVLQKYLIKSNLNEAK
jgi:chemotaxis protein CheD